MKARPPWTGWSRSASAALPSLPRRPPLPGIATTRSIASTLSILPDTWTLRWKWNVPCAFWTARFACLTRSLACSRNRKRCGVRPTSIASRASVSSTRWIAWERISITWSVRFANASAPIPFLCSFLSAVKTISLASSISWNKKWWFGSKKLWARNLKYLKSASFGTRRLSIHGLIAEGFAAIEGSPKLFVSSPYIRALQTAEIFAEELHSSKSKIEKSESLLPGAEPAAFFRELSHRKSLESVICFGHAPQLDELIAYALGSKRDVTELKKAGAACVELTRLHPPAGTLVWLMTPKALRKLAKGK